MKQSQNDIDFTKTLYNKVPEDEVKKMSEPDYRQFSAPLYNVLSYVPSFKDIFNSSSENNTSIANQNATITAIASGTISGASFVTVRVESNPQLFPGNERVIAAYKPKLSVNEEIEYIKSQLPTINPDISQDFNVFVQKYYAFKEDETKYQELIGARSMFFYKFIFKFSEDHYNVSTRREKIEKFVLGSSSLQPMDIPVIVNAYYLWKELSSQTASGESVKTGQVSKFYVEELFVRLIGVMASLLKLREKKFTLG